MPETLTDSLRRRLREASPVCPTCGQATGQSLRALGDATGVSFTVLARFLKGGDMTGRNLDLVDAYLAARLSPEPTGDAPDWRKAHEEAGGDGHTGEFAR